MSDKKIDQESIDSAIAKDFAACIERDLSAMSPGQLAVTRKVMADFEKKTADTSQRDMERKIARATDRELEEMIRDGDDAKRRSNG